MDASSPDTPKSLSAALTPMMAQYLAIKETAGDALLFYRMGDFYELFFDDAVKAAAALDITLTKRGKHGGDDIPMCGVPWHSHEAYLARLIKEGFKVAICEQTEDPAEAKKRGSKSVVRREIVRVVTPGTLTEDTLLDSAANNYLAALAIHHGGADVSIAWADISTGELNVKATTLADAGADVAALSCSEIIVADDADAATPLLEELEADGRKLTRQPKSFFASAAGERRLKEVFRLASLSAFGSFGKGDLAALGALLAYIDLTQVGRAPALRPPRRAEAASFMSIDQVTRVSLELLRTQTGERKGSLFSAVNRTVSGPGARLLAGRLSAPLLDPALINARLDAVSWFERDGALRDRARAALRKMPDVSRSMTRLSLERGGPRDLVAVRDSLLIARDLAGVLADEQPLSSAPAEIATACADLEARGSGGFSDLLQKLEEALSDEPPLLARDGGFIAKGYDAGLDSVRVLRDESRRHIAGLEAQYRDQTGVKNLKIKHNNVLGYFVETSPAHGDKLLSAPLDEIFIHRQTLASAVRFTTADLANLASEIARARDEALARELEIFDELGQDVGARAGDIAALAEAAAQIDVAAAGAQLAIEEKYVRPVIDDSVTFRIEAGRHPVVEQAVAGAGDAQRFVANDCALSEEEAALLWLVTGPNMAGKSTFLRQNALIAILAQAGCFVPAASAHIGVCDRVFSRVGAADDLAKGRSTFMVEMVETAAILNQATERSLVILDEIGRGTATFDGMSIAWAAVEHLHNANKCRGLFATHYHELTALSETLSRLKNASMRVREWKGDVIFLHEVADGPADRSYGVAVARLAGLPPSVIARAGDVLAMLESQKSAGDSIDALPLFAALHDQSGPAPQETDDDLLKEALAALDPDAMTPREAMDALYRLKSVVDDA